MGRSTNRNQRKRASFGKEIPQKFQRNTVEDEMIAHIEAKRIVAKKMPELHAAWEAADYKTLRKLAGEIENGRVALFYVDACLQNDQKAMEHYGQIVRDYEWPKPKTAVDLGIMPINIIRPENDNAQLQTDTDN